MTPTLRAALAVAATLLVAGCTTDTEDPGLKPADPGGTSTSPTPDEDAGTTGLAQETGDPLAFGGTRTTVTISCFPRGERRMVFYDGLRTDRPVTLTRLTTEASALRITGTYVREVPRREVDESGVMDLRPGRAWRTGAPAWSLSRAPTSSRTRATPSSPSPGSSPVRGSTTFAWAGPTTGAAAPPSSTSGGAPAAADAETPAGAMHPLTPPPCTMCR